MHEKVKQKTKEEARRQKTTTKMMQNELALRGEDMLEWMGDGKPLRNRDNLLNCLDPWENGACDRMWRCWLVHQASFNYPSCKDDVKTLFKVSQLLNRLQKATNWIACDAQLARIVNSRHGKEFGHPNAFHALEEENYAISSARESCFLEWALFTY